MRPRDDPRGASDGDPGPGRTGGGRPDPDGARAADVIARGVRGAEPGEVPGRLCEVAVELLPVIGASVSLRSEGMPVQLSASSAQAAHLSQIQATLGDGPCQSAVADGAPVLACDLTTGRDAGRDRPPHAFRPLTGALAAGCCPWILPAARCPLPAAHCPLPATMNA